jgi:hypothetical protein
MFRKNSKEEILLMRNFEDLRIEVQRVYGVGHVEAKNAIRGFEIEPLRREYQERYHLNGGCSLMNFCGKVFSKNGEDKPFQERFKYWTGMVEGAHGLHD